MTEWLIVIVLLAIFLVLFYNYILKIYNSEVARFFNISDENK